jgi:transcriptional regulator with XRE-family HTH domain
MKLKIKEAMKSNHIKTLHQLSQASGVANGYLSELDSGKYNNPSVKVL